MALALLLGLVSGVYARYWRDMLTNPVGLTALLLFAWLVLTLSYTEAPMDEAGRVLKKYRELLLIPLLLPLFLREEARIWGVRAFLAAMLFMLVVSYLDGFRQIIETGAISDDPVLVKNRITQSTLLSFAAFWLALQLFDDPRRRWLWTLLLVLLVVNVFFMLGGRTGLVIFLALAGLAMFQRYRWKGLVLTSIAWAVLVLGAYFASGHMQDRVQESVSGLADYQAGDQSTSTALRLGFLVNTLALVAERPVLGHGVGSFTGAYERHVAGTGHPPTVNPHNEFLLIGVQAGLIGMLLFTALLAQQWRLAARLPQRERRLAQALVVTMGIGCMFNSFLMDSTEGHFFAFFSALLFAHAGNPTTAEKEAASAGQAPSM